MLWTMFSLKETEWKGDGKDILPLASSLVAIGPPRLKSIPRRIRRFLIPTFLKRSNTQQQDAVRSTDFLDGMRGYAAFCVFIGHFVIPGHPKAHIGYGGGNGLHRNDKWIMQLPIIRLLYSGQVMVTLFFVISGFSISLKPLKLARRGSHGAVFDALYSATFRRTARLYIPSIITLFISLVMACCGAFDYAYALTKHWPFPGKPLELPTAYNTISEQTEDWLRHLWVWADPLNQITLPEHTPYGSQLWTIPTELKCSFISFLAFLGVAKASPTIRISTLTGISVYFHLRGHPECPLFLGGIVLAELFLIRQENSKHATESQSQKFRNWAIFIFGLFLASYPRRGGDKALFWPPFYEAARLIVSDHGKRIQYFFTSIASILLVWIVSKSPSLQAIFTTPVARYLGKTSFALYCVHQALINWFGYKVILYFWGTFGNETVFKYELGIGLAFVIQCAVTLWVSDVFWRAVDLPSVKFTKWMEEKCAASP